MGGWEEDRWEGGREGWMGGWEGGMGGWIGVQVCQQCIVRGWG